MWKEINTTVGTCLMLASAWAADAQARKRSIPTSHPAITSADIRAAAITAGLKTQGNRVLNECDEEIKGFQRKDLNSDGQAELIFGDAGICSGNAGFFIIVTRTSPGTWRKVLEGTGVYEFLRTRHQGWLDIQAGDPGCEGNDPRYSWANGRYVVSGRTARSCTTGATQLPEPVTPQVLSGKISYVGTTSYKGVSNTHDYELTVSGNTISGISAGQLFGRLWTVPVNGTYANGTCSVKLRNDTLTGPCDAHHWAGQRFGKKGDLVGDFAFTNADDLPSSGAVASTQAALPTYAPPTAVAVWSLGRARILAERVNCSADDRLGKAYCFDGAKAWLRRRPDKRDVDVIAMDRSYVIGALVPYNNGQGWDVYNVARAGDAYTADRRRHFVTKIPLPPGCMYQGVVQRAWYITIAGGRRVAVEAEQYACRTWSGQPLYTRGVDYAFVDAEQLDYAAFPTSVASSSDTGVARTAQRQSSSEDDMFGVVRGGSSEGDSTYIYGEPSFARSEPQTSASKCVANEAVAGMMILRSGNSPPVCKPTVKRSRSARKRQ